MRLEQEGFQQRLPGGYAVRTFSETDVADAIALRGMLAVAQDQHRQLLDAIEHHEGACAEAILREHSRLAQRNLRAAVSAQTAG